MDLRCVSTRYQVLPHVTIVVCGDSATALPPPPEAADVVVQHEEFLEQLHTLPLPSELPEELAQFPPPAHVEPEGLGEVLLRVRGCIHAHVVGQRGGDPPPLEVHPVLVRHPVRLPHFTEGRSEERRVGKECRSRWSPRHEKKK